MIEVLWHGRGGQGAFTAARLLGAAACFKEGQFALAFPSFGPERRGAPMRAFTKISAQAIGDRTAVTKADYVVYLDGTLLPSNWADELKPNGVCLVNSAEWFDDPRLLAIDADGMSSEVLGRPIPNTVFLGAVAALIATKGGEVSEAQLGQAIRSLMPKKLHDKNIQLVAQSYAQISASMHAACVNSHAVSAGETTASIPAVKPAAEPKNAPAHPAPELSAARARHSSIAHMPQLFVGMPSVAEYAATTCYKAGFLTQINAGWRNLRPAVNDEKCTGCLQCYIVCPDGAIFKVPSHNKAGVGVSVDFDFCKGCGVCANACKFGALEMVREQAALVCGEEGQVGA